MQGVGDCKAGGGGGGASDRPPRWGGGGGRYHLVHFISKNGATVSNADIHHRGMVITMSCAWRRGQRTGPGLQWAHTGAM